MTTTATPSNVPLSDWASAHGINLRVAQRWALAGRVLGAHKLGRDWYVPPDTPVPERERPGIKPRPQKAGD